MYTLSFVIFSASVPWYRIRRRVCVLDTQSVRSRALSARIDSIWLYAVWDTQPAQRNSKVYSERHRIDSIFSICCLPDRSADGGTDSPPPLFRSSFRAGASFSFPGVSP